MAGKMPEWVEKWKRKGTVIVWNGHDWRMYSNRSVRVPGKKNPQVVRNYIGKVTEDGVVVNVDVNIDKAEIRHYEYGFSYAMERLFPEKCYAVELSPEENRKVFLKMVEGLSPDSYLLMGEEGLEDVKPHLAEQMRRRFIAVSGLRLEGFERLKEIRLLDFGPVKVPTHVSDGNRELLAKHGLAIP